MNPNIGVEGKNTQFSSENQPKNNGRKPSLKKQLEKVALSDGWMTFKPKDVRKGLRKMTNKKGKPILDAEGKEQFEEVFEVRVPKEAQLALNLFRIGIGKNSAAVSAIKYYGEVFDGKATQSHKHQLLNEHGKPTMDVAWLASPAPRESEATKEGGGDYDGLKVGLLVTNIKSKAKSVTIGQDYELTESRYDKKGRWFGAIRDDNGKRKAIKDTGLFIKSKSN